MNPSDIIDSIVHTVLDWVLGLRGWTAVAGVLGMAFVETGLFIGLVVPGETAMAVAGVIAARQGLPLALLIGAGAIGAVAGDVSSYWFARKAGLGVVRRSPWLTRRIEPHLRGANRFFDRHGPRALVLGRWISWLRAVLPFTAGLGRMPFLRFLLWSAIAGVTWAATIVSLGYLVGEVFVRALRRWSTPIVLGFLVLAIVLWFVHRRHREELDPES